MRDRQKSMQQNRKPSHFGKQLGSSLKKKKTYIQLPYNTTIILFGNYLRKMKIYMYTNYYKQIWSEQFYFQLWKTEISPYFFHRWIWLQTMYGIYTYCAELCLVAQLHPTLCHPMDCSPPGSSVLGDSPGKNTGVGCHALLQGIFPTQGSNPGLPHFRWIL